MPAKNPENDAECQAIRVSLEELREQASLLRKQGLRNRVGARLARENPENDAECQAIRV
ncbi:hypothetical protein SAMN03159453_00088, partial [Pseudomonas sp. NFIX28]